MVEFEVQVELVIKKTVTRIVNATSLHKAEEAVNCDYDIKLKNHECEKYRVKQVDMMYLDEEGAQHCLLTGAPWTERESDAMAKYIGYPEDR